MDAIPENLRNAIPLYRREPRIMKPEELNIKGPVAEPVLEENDPENELGQTMDSAMTGVFSLREGPKITDAPEVYVPCAAKWVYVQVCCTVLWIVAAFSLLGLHVLRIQDLSDSTHQLVADSALRALEVNATGILMPALSMMRSLALAGRSGLFEGEDPYDALSVVTGPGFELERRLTHVKVLGLNPSRMIKVLPGRIHDLQARLDERVPVLLPQLTSGCRTGGDVMACFGLQTEGIDLHLSTSEAAALNWRGPSFIRQGPQGTDLKPATKWGLALDLVASLNVTGNPATGVSNTILLDVAIELGPLFEACRVAAPPNGHAFIATSEGLLLAGSSSKVGAGPVLQPATVADLADPVIAAWTVTIGDAEYVPKLPRLWDMPEAWVKQVTTAALEKSERVEIAIGEDLAVLRPLELGAVGGRGSLASASAETLRIGVFVPRAEAIRPLMNQLQFAAMGVLAAPFVVAVTLVTFYILYKILRTFIKYCC